jgi:hypothetical protein
MYSSPQRVAGGDRPTDEEAKAAAWTMHATGRLVHEVNQSDEVAAINLAAARDRAVGITSREDFYALMAERGLAYGPAFQVLDELHRGLEDAAARVVLPDSVVREAGRYHLHPALGDAMLQSMAGAVPLEEDGSFSPFTYMPVGIRRVRMAAAIDEYTRPLFTYAVRTSGESGPSPEQVEGNVYLVGAAGGGGVRGCAGATARRSGARQASTPAAGCTGLVACLEGGEVTQHSAPAAGAWLISDAAASVANWPSTRPAARRVCWSSRAEPKSICRRKQGRANTGATIDPLDAVIIN